MQSICATLPFWQYVKVLPSHCPLAVMSPPQEAPTFASHLPAGQPQPLGQVPQVPPQPSSPHFLTVPSGNLQLGLQIF